MTDKSSRKYKNTEVDGPDYDSHPDQGCDKSRGRKCEDCIYTECLKDNEVKNKMRRWVELPLGEGEYLYCKDCGKQLYGTSSRVKDAPREPAWIWVQVYTNPFALKDTKDIVQLVVCKACKKEEK